MDITPEIIDTNTKVLLHFNNENNVAKDECGNQWEVYNEPTVSTNNAKFNKALQLTTRGQYLKLPSIYLGGQDFTIDYWAWLPSSFSSYGSGNAGVFCLWNRIGSNYDKKLFCNYVYCTNCIRVYSKTYKYLTKYSFVNSLNHLAVTYQYNEKIFLTFLNGTIVNTYTNLDIPRLDLECYVGANHTNSESGLEYGLGYLSELRIVDGVAVWKADFTPPDELYKLE